MYYWWIVTEVIRKLYMRKYRLVVILKRELDKKAVDSIITEVKKLAGDVKNDNLTEIGEKKFAYKINNEQSGNYLSYEFEAEKVSSELENKLRLNDNVIRHLMTRLD